MTDEQSVHDVLNGTDLERTISVAGVGFGFTPTPERMRRFAKVADSKIEH
ncbi:MAG: hypothetical protein ABII39_00330 [Candidatus Micrarchaeota archaeon]